MCANIMKWNEVNPYLAIFVHENSLLLSLGSFGRPSSAGLFPFTDTVGYAGESSRLAYFVIFSQMTVVC